MLSVCVSRELFLRGTSGDGKRTVNFSVQHLRKRIDTAVRHACRYHLTLYFNPTHHLVEFAGTSRIGFKFEQFLIVSWHYE